MIILSVDVKLGYELGGNSWTCKAHGKSSAVVGRISKYFEEVCGAVVIIVWKVCTTWSWYGKVTHHNSFVYS